MSLDITITGQGEIDRLGRAIAVYASLGKLSLQELVRKKAYDLRIKLYRGYRAARWTGARKGSMESRGVAFTEMRRRAREGEGIVFKKGRSTPTGSHPDTDRRGRALSQYQLQVWNELRRRQAGIGVLAVSFLLKRWRWVKGEDGQRIKILKTNSTKLDLISQTEIQEQPSRTGEVLARVTLAPGNARIEGFTEGLAAVGDRSGIVPLAIRAVSLDTEIYLARKLGDNWEDVSRKFQLGGFAA
jgi:hypothetical protein